MSLSKWDPLFICSLKTDKESSLNEAAFLGIDLMNNLFALLLYFQTNFFVLLADIMMAFLQIRLLPEQYRSLFCFFLNFGGKYEPYRYNSTIIFGFISSLFIVNYVVQHDISLHFMLWLDP